jgi:hypothetical protein
MSDEMSADEKRQLELFTSVAEEIKLGQKSITEANVYLDSIGFDPKYRYPGVHINNNGETEYYLWKDQQWLQI